LQDVLRLLTLWFRHGSHLNVQTSLREGFAEVSIDTWLQVL
jgi:FKBP12-rapamycin complex-associated protein